MNGQHVEQGADVELDESKLINDIKNDLQFAHTKATPFLDIAVQNKLEHDNELNEEHMPTRSKMSLPYKFAQVEEMLGKAHEYLWPPMNTVEATPDDEGITLEQAIKVERGLYHMAKDTMRCPDECLPIERDSISVGFGYGIIEPFTYQKLERNIITAESDGGKLLARTVEMAVGDLRTMLRLRYVSPGQIIPYPDGYSPNGHGRSSILFFMDFMPEFEFRNFCSDRRDDSETMDFDVAKLSKEKIDSIVQKAKNGSNNNIPAGWFTHIKKLGGPDYQRLCGAQLTAEATIPILRVYRDNEHIWLANGDTIIYRQSARTQVFRRPILKMSAVRDGTHWYPYTTSEAMRDVNFNRNVWLNLVFDIMTWAANRPLVYSTTEMDKAPEFGPNSKIAVRGRAQDGAAFLAPPGIGADTLQVGAIMDDKASEISGMKDFTQKNFSRGGMHAFNDMLQSAKGKERIAGAVMESGFMHDLFEQILIYMQIAGIGFDGNTRSFNEETGTEEMAFLSVDSDDFKNSFTLKVSLDKKYSVDEFSISDRIAIFREIKDDPMFDPYEARRFLFGDDNLIHRMARSKQQMDSIQSQDRTDQRQATQLGIQKAQGRTPQQPEIAGAAAGVLQ